MKRLFVFAITLIIPIVTGLRCYACESTNSHCEGSTHYETCPYGYDYDACFVARNKSDFSQEYRQCGYKELCDVGFRNRNPTIKSFLHSNYEIVSVCTGDLCNGAIVDNCNRNNRNDADNGLQCYKCDSRDGEGKCNDGNEFYACDKGYDTCVVARSMNNSNNIMRACALGYVTCSYTFLDGDTYRVEATCNTDQCNGRGVTNNCLSPGSSDTNIQDKPTTVKYKDEDGLQCYQCKSTNSDCEDSIRYGTCKRGYDACFVARSKSDPSKEVRSCGYNDLCNSTNYNGHIRKLLENDEYQIVAVCDSDLCNGAIRDTCTYVPNKKAKLEISSTAITIIIVIVIVSFLLIVLVSALSKFRSRFTTIRIFV